MMQQNEQDQKAIAKILEFYKQTNIDISGAKVRRTSSRFCLGVEHGDYNGTELFGAGTDRFIWMAYKPNESGRIRMYSGNFPDDGIIEFGLDQTNKTDSEKLRNSWGRFAHGAEYILRREGYELKRGMNAIVYGNIPGGGMSRSASLTLNLILSLLDINEIEVEDKLKVAELAQAVENDFIGSPCGLLDQIMIIFAREGMGTRFDPKSRKVSYVPVGKGAIDYRLVSLDTGTVRPGLEKSTYKVRRAECEEFVEILQRKGYDIECLADIKDEQMYDEIRERFGAEYPNHYDRLKYIFSAQKRFGLMLEAWQVGDIETVGRIFREDGFGLRDNYKISGPELETMCEIARTVPGVLGERMLGGGDKGAAGAIVKADSIDDLKKAVDENYPKMQPAYADKYAVHVCKSVDGVAVFEGLV
ncbi:MAG: hypothetical protein PVG93_01125 [Phycisphaerales bacterium]|jgi:galactokinase